MDKNVTLLTSSEVIDLRSLLCLSDIIMLCDIEAYSGVSVVFKNKN